MSETPDGLQRLSLLGRFCPVSGTILLEVIVGRLPGALPCFMRATWDVIMTFMAWKMSFLFWVLTQWSAIKKKTMEFGNPKSGGTAHCNGWKKLGYIVM